MKLRLMPPLIIIIFSLIIAMISNMVSDNRIPFIGSWPSILGSDSIIVPPSAEENDPPFISLDQAVTKFQSVNVLFLDAREMEDYEIGRIRGAVNLPYDYLEDYWDEVLAGVPTDREIVVYCSGSECESSLFLGREMAEKGYKNIFIFYGGWREWVRAKLPFDGEQ